MEIHNLTQKHCVPCEGGMPPFTHEEVEKYRANAPQWKVVEDKKLAREFRFKNFLDAMGFINKIAPLAEAEGHHPDIYLFYNLVRLELMTHAVKGLSENDFIMAAKIDGIFGG